MKTSENSNAEPANRDGVIMLGAAELAAALTPARCLAALEDAYTRLHAAPGDAGRSLAFQTAEAKFHVKAGLYPGTHTYFAAKVNANFPTNPERYGLPTIQGLIVLSSGVDGRALAVIDSGELTGLRTAAATALAAKRGARADAATLAMVGCGAQARHQIAALMGVRPITRLVAADRDGPRAEALVAWAAGTFGLEAATGTIAEAFVMSDIAVTCTTSPEAFVNSDMVRPGCFIAAVGADNPDKIELAPEVFKDARILVDDAQQCAEGGDLAHAIRAGVASIDDVAASLAELAAGAKPGRRDDEEIVIFDSTGTGVQDVAACAAAYEAARPASQTV